MSDTTCRWWPRNGAKKDNHFPYNFEEQHSSDRGNMAKKRRVISDSDEDSGDGDVGPTAEVIKKESAVAESDSDDEVSEDCIVFA